MLTLACLNGELMPADEAKVSIWDRGFLFGDGIYEVFRLYEGMLWLETEHIGRLKRSLSEMQYPEIDLDRLMFRIHRTIQASEIAEGIVYIQYTRGVAPRKHAFPPAGTLPTELIVVKPYDDSTVVPMREAGVTMIIHPDLRWRRCDVKSINLLGNVIACEAAHKADALEAALFDEDGFVTEATHSSLMWIRDGYLEATPEGHEILPGTTRGGAVLRNAKDLGIPFREARIKVDQLFAADEVLLAGTTIEVMPVISIDGKTIADGRPGPMTKRLQSKYRESVETWLAHQIA